MSTRKKPSGIKKCKTAKQYGLADDEVLIRGLSDRRTYRSAFGAIKTGPIPSIWHLADSMRDAA